MPTFRIKEAAGLMDVGDDTLRRWADGGRVGTTTDASGRRAVSVGLAALDGTVVLRPMALRAAHDEKLGSKFWCQCRYWWRASKRGRWYPISKRGAFHRLLPAVRRELSRSTSSAINGIRLRSELSRS